MGISWRGLEQYELHKYYVYQYESAMELILYKNSKPPVISYLFQIGETRTYFKALLIEPFVSKINFTTVGINNAYLAGPFTTVKDAFSAYKKIYLEWLEKKSIYK